MSDRFLNIVFPFVTLYLSVIIFWSYFMNGAANGGIIDVIILVTITVLMLLSIYGFLALLKDLKETGTLDTLRYWFKKLNK